MNNELEQLCEIDGHNWTFHYFSYGLVLDSSTEIYTSTCQWCKKQEQKIFVPLSDKNFIPIYVSSIFKW